MEKKQSVVKLPIFESIRSAPESASRKEVAEIKKQFSIIGA